MFTKSLIDSKELNKLVKTLKPDLRLISILPSMNCNGKCNICHIWGDKGWAFNDLKNNIRDQIDINVLCEFIEDVLNNTNNDRQLWTLIAGGEPLLYKKIETLLKFLRKKQIPIILLTNGILLKRFSKMVFENVSFISTSLDGPPHINNKIRGVDNSFDLVCDGIQAIIEMKEEKNSIYPVIQISCTISPFNSEYIEEFIEAINNRFNSIGYRIKYKTDVFIRPKDIIINFESLLFTTSKQGREYVKEMKQYFNCAVSSTYTGLINDDLNLDCKAIHRKLEKIWAIEGIDSSKYIDLEEWFYDISNVFGHTRCLLPWYGLRIRPNGEVFFCPDIADYSTGNIYETSFKEIWEGERANNFRKILQTRLLPMCNRCEGLYRNLWNFPKLRQLGNTIISCD
jgi:sulfatase maturation enzyme AslB (radical SAM superfamily)